MPRPPKWNQEREDRLVGYLAEGAPRTLACELSGVDYKTFLAWIEGKRMPGRGHLVPFATRVTDAEAQAEYEALDTIRAHIKTGSLKASTWYLEHCRPERYAKTQNLNVKDLAKLSDAELVERALAAAKKTVTDE